MPALDLASRDVNLASLAPQAVDLAVAAYGQLARRPGGLGARAICLNSGRRRPPLAAANAQLMKDLEAAFARCYPRA